jgi:hypothetical protein
MPAQIQQPLLYSRLQLEDLKDNTLTKAGRKKRRKEGRKEGRRKGRKDGGNPT